MNFKGLGTLVIEVVEVLTIVFNSFKEDFAWSSLAFMIKFTNKSILSFNNWSSSL
jgi:hypothetical protein